MFTRCVFNKNKTIPENIKATFHIFAIKESTFYAFMLDRREKWFAKIVRITNHSQ